MNHKSLRLILIVLLILHNSGCAYRGTIRHDFYQPQVTEEEKIPFKAAIAMDQNFNTARYEWNDIGPSALSLQPGLGNAVVAQMSAIFQDVTMTEDTATFKGADFFILPSLVNNDPGSLQIVVRDVPSGKTLAVYSNTTPIASYCPFMNCGVPLTLSIFSVCLFCPVTVPWALQGSGRAMRKQIEAAIAENLSKISQKIEDDEPRLAARGRPLPPGPPARNRTPKNRGSRSKIDPPESQGSPTTRSENHPQPVRKFFHDGAYLAASPLRLGRGDIPKVLGIAAALGGAFALDRTTHNNLAPLSGSEAAKNLRQYGDIAQFSGPILGAAFAVHGWSADNPQSKKTAALAFESFLWAGAIELVIKPVVGRKRPSLVDDPFTFQLGQSDGAFPSGHTTVAFAAATVFAEQYPTWKVVAPAYAAAGAVGFSRITSNQHWGSDVLAGALLGIGVSHTLRKLYDKPDDGWRLTADPGGIVLSRRF
jgi:membrane-associated phospholipid phosphatase